MGLWGWQRRYIKQKTPQHIFNKKGNFLVSLTAKNGAETSTFIGTVSIIGPNIKIDGDFSDWQYVDYAFTNPDTDRVPYGQ